MMVVAKEKRSLCVQGSNAVRRARQAQLQTVLSCLINIIATLGSIGRLQKGVGKTQVGKKKKEKCMRFPTSTIFQSLSLLKVL